MQATYWYSRFRRKGLDIFLRCLNKKIINKPEVRSQMSEINSILYNSLFLRADFLRILLRKDVCLQTLSKPLGNCPLKYQAYFQAISALIDISHFCEKSDNKCGMWQATDGHAVSDPKTLHLHFWHPPNRTPKIFQNIMPENALLEVFYHCDFECLSSVSTVLF